MAEVLPELKASRKSRKNVKIEQPEAKEVEAGEQPEVKVPTVEQPKVEVKEEKIIYCSSRKTNGAMCSKVATHAFKDSKGTFLYCSLHARVWGKRAVISDKPTVTLLSTPKKPAVKVKFEDLIDEKSTGVTQCCIRPRPDQPLCAMMATYKLRNRYFCTSHIKLHPEAKDAKKMKGYAGKQPILMDIGLRLTKIEEDNAQMKAWLQTMMSFESFRSVVYAIGEGKGKVSLFTVDKALDSLTAAANAVVPPAEAAGAAAVKVESLG